MKQLSVHWLIVKACGYTGITVDQIYLRTRKREIFDARIIVISILKNYSNLTNLKIAEIFSVHHSTINSSEIAYNKLQETNKNFLEFTERLQAKFIAKFGNQKQFNLSELYMFGVVNKTEKNPKIAIARALVCH